MTTPSGDSIAERIRTLEQRLEHRRARLREDVDETKDAVQGTMRRWLPLAAVAGAGLAALWLTRRGGAAARARSPWKGYAGADPERRGVRWASLLGLATTAYKFGTSPQARYLLDALRRRSTGRRDGR